MQLSVDPRPIVPPCTGYCRGERAITQAAARFQKNTVDPTGPALYCACCSTYLLWAPEHEVSDFGVPSPGMLAKWIEDVPIGQDPNDANTEVERAVARCFHCQYDVRYFRLKPKLHA